MSFAIGIYSPKHKENIGTLFRSAQNFGAQMIFTVGRRYERQKTDTTKTWRHIPCLNFPTTEDMFCHFPLGWVPVAVEMDSDAVPLQNFHHPRSAIYILGSEDNGLCQEILRRVPLKVSIPTNRSLNVSVAGSIVMYDRMVKRSKPVNNFARDLVPI